MGWAYCGEDSRGRSIGYVIDAICDHPRCNVKIDRGLSYACGGMHGVTEIGCEQYYCEDHLAHTVDHCNEYLNICSSCARVLTDSGDWKLNVQDDIIEYSI